MCTSPLLCTNVVFQCENCWIEVRNWKEGMSCEEKSKTDYKHSSKYIPYVVTNPIWICQLTGRLELISMEYYHSDVSNPSELSKLNEYNKHTHWLTATSGRFLLSRILSTAKFGHIYFPAILEFSFPGYLYLFSR